MRNSGCFHPSNCAHGSSFHFSCLRVRAVIVFSAERRITFSADSSVTLFCGSLNFPGVTTVSNKASLAFGINNYIQLHTSGFQSGIASHLSRSSRARTVVASYCAAAFAHESTFCNSHQGIEAQLGGVKSSITSPITITNDPLLVTPSAARSRLYQH